MNTRPLSSYPSLRRAMTLVELLVVIAILGILGGAIFNVFTGTDRAARDQSLRQAQIAEARAVLTTLQTAFRANALAVAGENAEAVWAPTRCAFPVHEATSGPGLGTCRIELSEWSGGGESSPRGRIVVTRTFADGEVSHAAAAGVATREHSYVLQFDYATDLNGVEPVWVSEAPADGPPPRLVRARVAIASAATRMDSSPPPARFEVIFGMSGSGL